MNDFNITTLENPSAPMRPIYRFLLSVIFVVIANIMVAPISFRLLTRHVVVADTIYRCGTAALLAAGFLGFSYVLDHVEIGNWAYIGLPLSGDAVKQTAIGIGIGALLVSIAVGAIAVFGNLHMNMNVSGKALLRLGLVTVLLLGGAMLEELMFRGYPFQRLVESVGAWAAIAFLSILFGAVHLGNPNSGGVLSWGFFNTIVVGALLAYAYLRTRTLWLSFGIHFAWNFFLGVVFGLPVSGLMDFAVVVRSQAHGSTLLTGGAYGIEASMTGAFVILLGYVLVAFVPRPTAIRATPEPSLGI